MKKNNGITLIALVVTIVILIILATISISIILNDGFIDRTVRGKELHELEREKERLELVKTDVASNTNHIGKVTVDTYVEELMNQNITTPEEVTDNGDGSKTVITDTGHTAETARDEDAVLISIKEKDLMKVTIKYIYTIRVTNQGEIDGYATEIKDHIPEGLEFFEADNTEYGWKEVSGGIITTDYLKDTLLEANEKNYAEVKVVLTWINNPENLGEKVNLAEISKDKNKGDVPDIDSTPDNLEPGRPYEDDEDDAPVILALQTGSEHLYIGLMGAVLLIFAAGVTLIKKYVL